MHGFGIGGAFASANVNQNIRSFSTQISQSIQRLASGNKFAATYDPTSISISERLKSEINDTVSLVKSMHERISMAELGRSEAMLKVDVMHRIKELAVAYNNDTLSDAEKSEIQAQVDELSKFISGDRDFGKLKTDIKITTLDKFEKLETQEGSTLDVLSVKGSDDTTFVLFQDVKTDGTSLIKLLENNSSFIADAVPGRVINAEWSMNPQGGVSETSVERHMFNLEQYGVQDSIDSSLDDFVSMAVSLTAEIDRLEIGIDEMLNKEGILQNRLTNMTATDIAEETRKLMKAQLGREMGVNVLKVQNDLEKSMILSLLTF